MLTGQNSAMGSGVVRLIRCAGAGVLTTFNYYNGPVRNSSGGR
jgi:hypothetical protein